MELVNVRLAGREKTVIRTLMNVPVIPFHVRITHTVKILMDHMSVSVILDISTQMMSVLVSLKHSVSLLQFVLLSKSKKMD